MLYKVFRVVTGKQLDWTQTVAQNPGPLFSVPLPWSPESQIPGGWSCQ